MEGVIDTDVRFVIVPNWVVDLEISDKAFRIYAILSKYVDNDTLSAFPSRALLARQARCSLASVDRAITELVEAKAITKKHRIEAGQYKSSLYTVVRGVASPMKPPSLTHEAGVAPPVTNRTIPIELDPINYIETSKKSKSIPEPFVLSIEIAEDLQAKYPSLDLSEQRDAFVDFHTAKGSLFKSWDAAFRTWCRNSVRFAEPKTVIHKQELKPAAVGPGKREWVRSLHEQGEHFECKPGEFGCKQKGGADA